MFRRRTISRFRTVQFYTCPMPPRKSGISAQAQPKCGLLFATCDLTVYIETAAISAFVTQGQTQGLDIPSRSLCMTDL